MTRHIVLVLVLLGAQALCARTPRLLAEWNLHIVPKAVEFTRAVPFNEGQFGLLSLNGQVDEPDYHERTYQLHILRKNGHVASYAEETLGMGAAREECVEYTEYSRWNWVNQQPSKQATHCEQLRPFSPLQLLRSGEDLVLHSGEFLMSWNPSAGWSELGAADYGRVAIFGGQLYQMNPALFWYPNYDGPIFEWFSTAEKRVDGEWEPLGFGTDLVATETYLFAPAASWKNRVYYTSDGIEWSHRQMELPVGYAPPNIIASGPDSFLAYGTASREADYLAVVDHRGLRSKAVSPEFREVTPLSGVFFDGQWVLYGWKGGSRGFYTSADGVEWRFQEESRRISHLAADGERLVAVGPEGLVMSTNAQTAPVMRELFDHPYLLENGWHGTLWFGDMWYEEDLFPRVYHWNHGWIRFGSRSGDGVWFRDRKLGWMWASRELSPLMYSLRRNSWLQFAEDVSKPGSTRWFYDYGIGEWISVG